LHSKKAHCAAMLEWQRLAAQKLLKEAEDKNCFLQLSIAQLGNREDSTRDEREEDQICTWSEGKGAESAERVVDEPCAQCIAARVQQEHLEKEVLRLQVHVKNLEEQDRMVDSRPTLEGKENYGKDEDNSNDNNSTVDHRPSFDRPSHDRPSQSALRKRSSAIRSPPCLAVSPPVSPLPPLVLPVAQAHAEMTHDKAPGEPDLPVTTAAEANAQTKAVTVASVLGHERIVPGRDATASPGSKGPNIRGRDSLTSGNDEANPPCPPNTPCPPPCKIQLADQKEAHAGRSCTDDTPAEDDSTTKVFPFQPWEQQVDKIVDLSDTSSMISSWSMSR